MTYDLRMDICTLEAHAARLRDRLASEEWVQAQAEAAAIRQQMMRIEALCAHKAATEP